MATTAERRMMMVDKNVSEKCVAMAKVLTNFLCPSSPVTIICDNDKDDTACILTSVSPSASLGAGNNNNKAFKIVETVQSSSSSQTEENDFGFDMIIDNTYDTEANHQHSYCHDSRDGDYNYNHVEDTEKYITSRRNKASSSSRSSSIVNRFRSPQEYGVFGTACSYKWKHLHLSLDPDKTDIIECIKSAGIVYGHEKPDVIGRIATFVYSYRCHCGEHCIGRTMHTIAKANGANNSTSTDGEFYNQPLPVLLPAPFYDISQITKSVVSFDVFITHALLPICTVMMVACKNNNNNVLLLDAEAQNYLSHQKVDPLFSKLCTTFECALDCVSKKIASSASNLFAAEVLNSSAYTPLTSRRQEQRDEEKELFAFPEQFHFEGFPNSVMQEARDIKLVAPNTVITSWSLPVLGLIIAGHAIDTNTGKLVCTSAEPMCMSLKHWIIDK